MKASLHQRTLLPLAALALTWGTASVAGAQENTCPDLPNPVYGGGGSAVTATLGHIATALRNLPEEESITIFYADPGACAGYLDSVAPSPPTKSITYKYWNKDGSISNCQAPANLATYAHMGNTPALCPVGAGDILPEDWKAFSAPVQTINFITHKDSKQQVVAAEALYQLFGFGAGQQDRAGKDRSVEPWVNPAFVWGRSTNSFVHQIIAGALNLSASHFTSKVLSTHVVRDNQGTVNLVGNAANPDQSIGYVSGSAADDGYKNGNIKTLAYQHWDQSHGYLPDSTLGATDKINVRRGQYFLWTPAWLYAKVDSSGKPVDPNVARLAGWFDGSLSSPTGLTNRSGEPTTITDIFIQSGDIPLCAMYAIRPNGDLSAIQSYAPAEPCHSYFEAVATGNTSKNSCSTNSDCKTEELPECRNNYCEAY